jgi:hypothetical protein
MKTLTLIALIAVALPAALSLPAAAREGVMVLGDEAQEIRTCRPGERPASARSCRQPGARGGLLR